MRTAALTSLLVIALPRAQALLLPRAHALAPRLVRVRALTTLAVETAPQRTEAEEEWFPAGADEETLKKHFKRLAAREVHASLATHGDPRAFILVR